jgi:hypothetical protein
LFVCSCFKANGTVVNVACGHIKGEERKTKCA